MAALAADDREKQSFIVQSESGRTFKMVIRGELSKLPVEKIKRYLRSYGVPDGQSLTCDGRLLTDDMIGEDFGLAPGTVLRLWGAPPVPAAITRTQAVSEGLAVDVEGRQRQQRFAASASAANPAMSPGAFSTDSVAGRAPWTAADISRGAFQPFSTTPNAASGPFDASAEYNHRQPSPTRALPFSSSSAAAGGARYGYGHQQQQHSHSAEAAMVAHPLQSRIAALEEENARVRREAEQLRAELEQQRARSAAAAAAASTAGSAAGGPEGLLGAAKANLTELGKELGMHLVFDQNLTCVVGSDERNTLLVTFDAATERLYVYSTVLSFLPDEPAARLRLFEALLDGALLGRDMCGGGVGASLQSGLVMMSTSLPLRHCDRFALRDTVPIFVEALMRWRAAAADIVGSGAARR